MMYSKLEIMKALVLAFAMLLALSPLEAAKKTKTPKSANAKRYNSSHKARATKAGKLKKQNQSRLKRIN
jgi:hypothetical protein